MLAGCPAVLSGCFAVLAGGPAVLAGCFAVFSGCFAVADGGADVSAGDAAGERDRVRAGAGGNGPDLDGSARGGRGRTDGTSFADCSAAASCSGRGRDTSLARMAASTVIFIPGIGTLHRYPFPARH